jgi:hypothetical protein
VEELRAMFCRMFWSLAALAGATRGKTRG